MAIEIGVQSTVNTGLGLVAYDLNTPAFATPGSNDFVGPMPSTGAAGGFVLYPNKPNTNMMQNVYAK